MKRFLGIFAVVFILIFTANYQNSTNVRLIVSHLVYTNSLTEGDLRYQINLFNIFPAGEAVICKPVEQTSQKKTVIHVQAIAKTSSFINRIYPVQARADSYISVQSGNPLRFTQEMLLHKKTAVSKEVLYDQDNLIMSIAGVQRSILPDTQDPLSLMQRLVHMDLSKTQSFSMNLNTNQKNYIFSATVVPQELKLDTVSYQLYTVKASIQRREKNNPYHRSYFTIVFLQSADGNLPVSIRVFAGGAFINARLLEVK